MVVGHHRMIRLQRQKWKLDKNYLHKRYFDMIYVNYFDICNFIRFFFYILNKLFF